MTHIDLTSFQAELNTASAALQDFAQGPARRAADEVGASFERAGERIARALGAAALGGETAFKRMVKTVLEELAKIALEQVLGRGGGSRLSFSGGEGGGKSAAPVIVNFLMGAGGDANGIARHQGQIAAAIARAVAYGARNL
jgi:Lambda phage tail tape-measure protein (Tape_meas_lam_C)